MTTQSKTWRLKIAILPIIAMLLGGTVPIANAVEPDNSIKAVTSIENDEDYQLILTSKSGKQFFEFPSSAPILEANLNKKVSGEKYRLFILDMTIDKVIGINGAQGDWVPAIKPGFSFGDPHYYQAFYASYTTKTYNDVTKFSELSDIKASSNIISLTRSPWSVTISAHGAEAVNVSTTTGGGMYVTYLVDDKTNQIIWNN